MFQISNILFVSNLSIKTCIRRSKGMCCVEFAVCITDTQGIALIDTTSTSTDAGSEGNINEGWSIDTDVSPFAIEDVMDNASYFDAQCWTDYVEIPCKYYTPKYHIKSLSMILSIH